jgi:hypothetical protein
LSDGVTWRMMSTERSVSAFTKVGVLKKAAIYSEPLFRAGYTFLAELNIDENLAAESKS